MDGLLDKATQASGGAGRLNGAAIAMVRLYQTATAPRVSHCRYWPSCSEYTIQALDLHGLGRGGWLALRRMGRCQPWGSSGVDEVPTRLKDALR